MRVSQDSAIRSPYFITVNPVDLQTKGYPMEQHLAANSKRANSVVRGQCDFHQNSTFITLITL